MQHAVARRRQQVRRKSPHGSPTYEEKMDEGALGKGKRTKDTLGLCI